jgi:SAM-dependent methyltransferase
MSHGSSCDTQRKLTNPRYRRRPRDTGAGGVCVAAGAGRRARAGVDCHRLSGGGAACYTPGAMMERQFADYNLDFTDDRLAALYDVFYPPARRDDFAFYLPLIMAARAVLDVGCGTGALLRRARESGHTGRLCGLDPASGMLNQARVRSDIEWVLGDLSSVGWDREFDLVVMTGHAFQEFIEDEEIRAALTAIRSALTDHGRFAFETRNPPASWGMLRFLDAATLSSLLCDAGLTIDEQFGDWTGQPLTDAGPEIITIARMG